MGWKQNSAFLVWIFLVSSVFIPLNGQISPGEYPEQDLELPSDEGSPSYEPEPSETENYYSTEPDGIDPDQKYLQEEADHLDYSETVVKPKEKKKEKPKENNTEKPLEEVQEKKETGSSFWRGDMGKAVSFTLAFVLLVALVVFIMLKLNKSDVEVQKNMSFNGALPPELEGLDLHVTEVEDLLGNAIKRGDFRMALRLLYIKNLQILIQKGHVKLGLQKTNGEYVRELRNEEIRQNWRGLTRDFEWFWYGELQPDKTHFSELRKVNEDFYNKVRLES
ncbi:MAG: hypothetical protein KG003_11325 [Bacteroidetes bacterium]|nr:hypothetical protein [Bacteroidota bacterium]